MTAICQHALISSGSRHDVTYARKILLVPGFIAGMDHGYNVYKLFVDCTQNDIYFVTRLSANADSTVIAENPILLVLIFLCLTVQHV